MGIIGTVLFLATEAIAGAESEGGGGFGLNADIFETNIINLAILIGVLVYFGRNVLSNTLKERRSNIEATIQEAEARAKEAASALFEAQQKLTQAQAEAQRIVKASEESARASREAILAEAAKDVQRLKETASRDLDTEREKAIAEVRARVVALALQKVESQLQTGIADDAQHRLIDRSIALLGGS